MADDFANNFDSFADNDIETTPNIEIQLNKFESFENFTQKYIKETSLFANDKIKHNLIQLYKYDCDLPIIIYGPQGIGKLTTAIGLIQHIPCYMSDNKEDEKINNLIFFKIFDNQYSKILCSQNIFYINLNIFKNDNEISEYLRYILKFSKSKTFQGERKIFIISHLDNYNKDIQKSCSHILDRLNGLSSFIFIVNKLEAIQKKILSTCIKLHYNRLTEDQFTTILKNNYKSFLTDKDIKFSSYFYKIYTNNKYNIGNTIAFIKYIKLTNQINTAFLKKKENIISLTTKIAHSFIKKQLVLSTVEKVLEIRKFIYIILSININPICILKELATLLLHSKLNNNIKGEIIHKISEYSLLCIKANKVVIPLETLIYNLIVLIYS
jgi:DNA polymerase III delta prime subunit